jgi:hypothetical protein
MVSYLIRDENSEIADPIIWEQVTTISHVPSLWLYEIASAFRLAEIRKRITEEDTEIAMQGLKIMMVDHHHPSTESILEISRQTGLTVYDASYIALCLRDDLPLATLDKKLRSAAIQFGIKVLV